MPPTPRRRRDPRARAPRSTNTTRTAPGTGCSPAGCAIRSGWRTFPGHDVLWTAVNERDHLGDDLVPDFITSVRDGGFYGWPYSYIGQHVDPTVTPPRPDLVAKAIAPDVLLPSHCGRARPALLHGVAVPGRIPQQRVRRAARIDQSLEAVGLRRRLWFLISLPRCATVDSMAGRTRHRPARRSHGDVTAAGSGGLGHRA